MFERVAGALHLKLHHVSTVLYGQWRFKIMIHFNNPTYSTYHLSNNESADT